MVRSDCYQPYRGTPQLPPSPLTPPHFLGLAPHPGNKAAAAPARPPLPPPPPGWTRSYHAVPAAYPRQLREAHGKLGRASHPYRTSEPGRSESTAERKKRLTADAIEVVRQRYAATEWSMEEAMEESPAGLFLAAERWKRDIPIGGRTLVCTHANGMQKEHWHPVLYDILARDPLSPGVIFGTTRSLSHQLPVDIDDIWMFDDTNSAASVDLNEGLMGPVEIWDDVGRDMLNFILHVLPQVKASGEAPWQLEWSAKGSFPPVRVIGFGASFGGCGHVMAAHARPDAYDGLFLADPMVPPRLITPERWEKEGLETTFFRARNSLKRRDTWPSRSAAREAMLKLDFYQKWDKRIFDVTLSHGLVPTDPSKPDGEVTLATPSWSETAIFCEPFSPARAWDMLPHLRVPVGFLMARNPERTGGERITQELVWRPPLARNERLVDADHLIVQENPTATAESAWRFLQTLSSGQWGNGQLEIRASYAERDKARL